MFVGVLMNKYAIVIALLITAISVIGAEKPILRPFEREGALSGSNPIDVRVLDKLRKEGIEPANLCSDEVFIRRVFIDVIGTLPKPDEVRAFLSDTNPNKRSRLIDSLLQREEFNDYWTLKWCDVLRVKSEFPINLWPNAVQAYNRWIYDAIRTNMPYDKFARELLTSSGSNFRVPPVNFYRAIQGRSPSSIAKAAALTFMGTRLEKLPESALTNMEVFFSRVAYKSTDEWKEEIVYLDPKAIDTLNAVFPDGNTIQISPDQDPRKVFADWLITPGNPWFARCIVNRIWAWLMGRGSIHEPDDIRPDNPASNPQLLAYLERELVKSRYDLRHIYKLILNSGVYQQSSIPQSKSPDAESLFAYYPVRRLEAEVLIDALDYLCGTTQTYSSNIPEPYTFIPEENRTIELADASITSQFLEMFGRPSRDTGLDSERSNQPSDFQRLYLLNSNDIKNKIERSPLLRRITAESKGGRGELINNIYLNILSRFPSESELAVSQKYFLTPGISQKAAVDDLAWALINTKEFLYRH